MRNVFAVLKLTLFVLNCLWVIPVQSLVLLCSKGPASYHIPALWHRLCCLAFGIRVNVIGTPSADKHTLYMSNHISYLDISILGSLIKSSFVAKSEVEGWALFGFLSGLQQTVYVQRDRSRLVQEKNALQTRIESGESMIIFPEGTSTSGFEVIPFKSSLFSLAMNEGNEDLYVQPITIRIQTIHGATPDSKEARDIYAWPRDVDIELHHHLWRFAKTSGATLDVIFHPPLKATEHKDRKILAKACYERVSKGLEIAQAA